MLDYIHSLLTSLTIAGLGVSLLLVGVGGRGCELLARNNMSSLLSILSSFTAQKESWHKL